MPSKRPNDFEVPCALGKVDIHFCCKIFRYMV